MVSKSFYETVNCVYILIYLNNQPVVHILSCILSLKLVSSLYLVPDAIYTSRCCQSKLLFNTDGYNLRPSIILFKLLPLLKTRFN